MKRSTHLISGGKPGLSRANSRAGLGAVSLPDPKPGLPEEYFNRGCVEGAPLCVMDYKTKDEVDSGYDTFLAYPFEVADGMVGEPVVMFGPNGTELEFNVGSAFRWEDDNGEYTDLVVCQVGWDANGILSIEPEFPLGVIKQKNYPPSGNGGNGGNGGDDGGNGGNGGGGGNGGNGGGGGNGGNGGNGGGGGNGGNGGNGGGGGNGGSDPGGDTGIDTGGSGQIIAGVSNSTLLLAGGGAVAATALALSLGGDAPPPAPVRYRR